MLRDILPSAAETGKTTSAEITIVLPVGWRQMENRVDGIITTNDLGSEVVSIGKEVKYRKVYIGNTSITISTSGEWLFTRDELVGFCQQIYIQLRTVFGSDPTRDVLVNVFRFPQQTSFGQWQAETRGRNITIISSDMPFKTQSLQRLHEQLRHEMFHLWIPNGVNLSGNYDWFYEGFALYQSLKTAVALNQIRFDDFLDTLSRAHAIDARQTQRLSLIDASKDRWDGADTYIYARGMITAFLCDVLVLHNSKGRQSVTDILRELYAMHRYPNARTDGNAAVLAILQNKTELAPIVHRYINGPEKFEWLPEIALAGLETNGANKLAVMPKLRGWQKEILNKLGYNNWRKIGR
jgi:predicted metalloprotease with PDZ domain